MRNQIFINFLIAQSDFLYKMCIRDSNLAIDLKGENILMDMILEPENTHAYFYSIARVVERFFSYIYSETKTTSISVNRVACLLERCV